MGHFIRSGLVLEKAREEATSALDAPNLAWLDRVEGDFARDVELEREEETFSHYWKVSES